MLAVGLAGSAQAQSPAPLAMPDLDLTNAGVVVVFVRQPDGGLVVGGAFDSIAGQPRSNLARFRPDGSLDPAWNPSPNGFVSALAVDGSGAVFVGGGFTQIGGLGRQYLAKLSGSGEVDPDWNPSPNQFVEALAVDGNGSVYVGGYFRGIKATSRNYVAKLSATGTGALDLEWNPNVSAPVLALAVGADGAVFAGGAFSRVGGIGGPARSRIAKFSGSGTGALDLDWNPSASGGYVRALALDGIGALYAGGDFTMIGGEARNRIAKLSAAGTGAADPNWNPSPDGITVHALALDGNGSLYVAGDFRSLGGAARDLVAKLSTTGEGAADAGWHPSPDKGVESIALDIDGRVMIGGRFTHVDQQMRLGLAAINVSGIVDASIDTESESEVNEVVVQPDGGVIVGGDFEKAEGQPRANLLRLHSNGELDADWNPTADGPVSDLALDSNGAIFVAGSFGAIGGVPRSYVAKLLSNGVVDPDWQPTLDNWVNDLVVDGSGTIYIGGEFNRVNGQSHFRIAKLSGTGSGNADPDWTPYLHSGAVIALALDGAGSIYASGTFYGEQGKLLAKYSTEGTGASADPGWSSAALDHYVGALAVDTGGNLYAAGNFRPVSGPERYRLAKLNSSGIVDPDWNPAPNSYVSALVVDEKGSVYAGGDFSTIGGQSRNHLAKLSAMGPGAADLDWNPSVDGSVDGMSLNGSGFLYIAGRFTRVGESARDQMAALSALPSIFSDGFE